MIEHLPRAFTGLLLPLDAYSARVVLVVAFVLAAGCGSQGTSIEPALKLLSPDTQAVAVLDLAVMRKDGSWDVIADPLEELLDHSREGADGGESTWDVLSGWADDVEDSANIELLQDVDAIIVADGEAPEDRLWIALGRDFDEADVDELLEERELDAERERHGESHYYLLPDETAVAVIGSTLILMGHVDGVEEALSRHGRKDRSARDHERLMAALKKVKRPATAYVVAVPERKLLRHLESSAGIDAAREVGTFAAWLRVEKAGASLGFLADTGSAGTAGDLAGGLEDWIDDAADRFEEPVADLLSELDITPAESGVTGAARFDAEELLEELADVDTPGILLSALRGGTGAGVDRGSRRGGRHLLGPLPSEAAMVFVLDMEALRAVGLPSSIRDIESDLGVYGVGSELGDFAFETGFDPVRELEAMAVGVVGPGSGGADELVWLASARTKTPLSLERLQGWLEKRGKRPSREKVEGADVLWWGELGSEIAVAATEPLLFGSSHEVMAALARGRTGGESLSALLPPSAEPLVGALDLTRLSGARDLLGGFAADLSGVSFAMGKEGSKFTGAVWLAGSDYAVNRACDEIAGAATGFVALGAGLSAERDGDRCRVEFRISETLLGSDLMSTLMLVLPAMEELMRSLSRADDWPGDEPPDWIDEPDLPDDTWGVGPSGSDLVDRAKKDPTFGTREHPIPVERDVEEEYEFLRSYPCGAGGHFTSMMQRLILEGGKAIDEVEAVCTEGSDKRTFYFDVTSVFGKK